MLDSHCSISSSFVLERDRILVAIDRVNSCKGVLSSSYVLCNNSAPQEDVPRRWKYVLHHNVMLCPWSKYYDIPFLFRRFSQNCDNVFALFLD